MDNNVSRLRRNAINIHRAFAGMHPVIQRTRLLSLNAVVASARSGTAGVSFGIIANELSGVAKELSRLIGEMEGLFRTVVGHVARSVRDEDRLRLYSRSLERVTTASEAEAQEAPDKGAAGAAQGPESGASMRAELRAQIDRSRNDFIQGLDQVEGLSRQLVARINRVNWVAVRQSHITAVAARIEAARAGQDSGLTEVAHIVRDLANQIGTAESAAKGQIEDLCALAIQVVQPFRKDREHAQIGGVA